MLEIEVSKKQTLPRQDYLYASIATAIAKKISEEFDVKLSIPGSKKSRSNSVRIGAAKLLYVYICLQYKLKNETIYNGGTVSHTHAIDVRSMEWTREEVLQRMKDVGVKEVALKVLEDCKKITINVT